MQSVTWIGDLAVGEELHEEHPVGPDVWLDRELAELNGLRGRPLHREPRTLKQDIYFHEQ